MSIDDLQLPPPLGNCHGAEDYQRVAKFLMDEDAFYSGIEMTDLGQQEQPKPETILADEQLEAQLDAPAGAKPSIEIKSVPQGESGHGQIGAEQQGVPDKDG